MKQRNTQIKTTMITTKKTNTSKTKRLGIRLSEKEYEMLTEIITSANANNNSYDKITASDFIREHITTTYKAIFKK